MVIALTLGAALCNALSSILQKWAAQAASSGPGSSGVWRFVTGLLRRPAWLFGTLALIVAFVLHASALAHGELATVQLCLASELLFVLAILVIWFDQPLGPQEWLGGAALAIGIAGFLTVSAPSGGSAHGSVLAWTITAAVALAIMGAAVFLGRLSYGSRPAGYFGVAAAVDFAVTAALMKVAVDYMLAHGVVAMFASWSPYAMVGSGITALLLSGKAFERGSIAAAQAAFSGIDPVASIAIGVGVFGEHLRGGPVFVSLELISLLVMFAGVVVLSTSPLVFRAERLPAPRRRLDRAGACSQAR